MAKRTSDDMEAAIIERYQSGESAPAIGQALGTSSSNVYRILDRHGIDQRMKRLEEWRYQARKFSPDEDQAVAAAYRAGAGMDALASRYGCAQITIKNALRRQQEPIRRRGNALRDFSPEVMADMQQRYEAGQSQHAIGQALGLSQSVVGNALGRVGVIARGRRAHRESHGMWKGGRIVLNGYVAVMVPPDSPYRFMADLNGYVLEHRLAMAELLGRPLLPSETVHHIDGNRQNNALENLQLRIGRHGKGVVYRCADCGSHNIIPVALTETNIADRR